MREVHVSLYLLACWVQLSSHGRCLGCTNCVLYSRYTRPVQDLLNTTLHIHVERRYGGRMPRQLQNQLGMFL